MSSSLYFPPAKILPRVASDGVRLTLRELLALAGAQCRASGGWTERVIYLSSELDGVEREPGDWAAVRIGVPKTASLEKSARHACTVMAYSLMDLVARESIKGEPWARPAKPMGRPKKVGALSNSERQSRHRAKLKALTAASEA